MNYALEMLFVFGMAISLWDWFASSRKSAVTPPYKTIYVAALPQCLEPKAIYISGEDSQEWFASLLCPCRCQEIIQLSILAHTKPKWKLTKHVNGTISLHPSIWRIRGCKSHFFFEEGNISWFVK